MYDYRGLGEYVDSMVGGAARGGDDLEKGDALAVICTVWEAGSDLQGTGVFVIEEDFPVCLETTEGLYGDGTAFAWVLEKSSF